MITATTSGQPLEPDDHRATAERALKHPKDVMAKIKANRPGSNAIAPYKPDRATQNGRHSNVKSVANDTASQDRRHQIPIGPSKLHRSSTPRFPALALVRR